MIDLRIKEWEKLQYIYPIKVLPRLRELQIMTSQMEGGDRIKNLRTNRLKHHGEKRIAAIFCFGMSCILKQEVVFTAAPANDRDYDIVSRYTEGDTIHYLPVQIKEVVPEGVNSVTNLQKIIDDLGTNYPTSVDLTVVIYLNRTGKFKISDIQVPKLNIAALWILFASDPSQNRWLLVGNMLDNLGFYEYVYPTKEYLEAQGIKMGGKI